MRGLNIILIYLFLASYVNGQYVNDLIPRISSDNSISERIAYTKITIEYGSPKVRGREIWGDMEEYGQIWRAGANMATTISFSEDVKIQNQDLPAGIYAFFVIPEKSREWTIVFNKVAEQWGAFSYEESEDALRIQVQPMINAHVEDLTFDIIANDFEGAQVTLAWEKIKLSFFVEVQHLDVLEKMLKEKTSIIPENTQWVAYLQAANYLIDREEWLPKAQEWLLISESLYKKVTEWSGQYYPQNYILGDLLWAKAKLSALEENFKDAIQLADEMKALDGDYTFYEKENLAEQIDSKIKFWNEKHAK